MSEIILTSPLKPLNRFQQNLTESKISTSSIKFVFCGRIGKTKLPPWPQISCDIFNFFSETAKRNSKKIDNLTGIKDLKFLYQVCVVFGLIRKKKQDGNPGLRFTETFSTSPLKPLGGIQRNLAGSKISKSSTKFLFFGRFSKQKWSPWPIRQKGGPWYSGARYGPFGPLVRN